MLVQVKAAGINRPDILQRKGLYPPPPGASPLLGLEVAGVVARTGPAVTNVKEGDEVMALTNGGGYAKYVAVESSQVCNIIFIHSSFSCQYTAAQTLPKPRGMSYVEAACVPETLFTVVNNVFMRGNLAANERFLVHGGSGGIGRKE